MPRESQAGWFRYGEESPYNTSYSASFCACKERSPAGCLLSRVQAIRDYKGPDCRFLHLKTGDVIFVYHKLSGKRSDLWAGSMGKLFGYFAKDAVRTEELYAPKEIQIPTKDEDFLCVDGSMPSMENEDEWEAEDIQNSESQTSALVLDIAAEGHVSSSSHDEDFSSKERSSVLVQHNEDNKEMEVSEQSGSSWLGSGFTNWLGFGEQKGQEAKPEITQEDSFKGRKIALDLSDNIREDDIVEIMETKKPDPIDNGLSSVLNFDKRETVQLEDTKNVMPQKNDKMGKINTVKEGEESTFKKDNQQLHMGQESSSSSWIPFSISKVLSLSRETDDRQTHEKNENIKRDHGEDVEKVLDEKKQEKKISEDSIVQDHNDTIKGHDHVHAEKEEPLPYMQNGEQLSPNFVSENKKNEPASIQEDQMKDEQNKEEEKSGWYSTFYSSVLEFGREHVQVFKKDVPESSHHEYSKGMATPGPDQETYFTGSDETKIEASVTNKESEVLFSFRGVQSILKTLTFKQNDQSLKTTGPNLESTNEAILTNSVRNQVISDSARETILMESQEVSSAERTNELNRNHIEAINTNDFQNEGSLSESALEQQTDNDDFVKFKGHDLHLEERNPFNKEISKSNDCLEDICATTEEQLHFEVSDELLSETYEGQKDINRYPQAEGFNHQNVDNFAKDSTSIITSGSSGKPLMEEKSKESQNSHIYFYENYKNGVTLAKDKPSATMDISDLNEMVCEQHEVTSDIYNMNESSQDTPLHTEIMSKIKEQPTFAKHLNPKFDFYSLIVPKWKKCFPRDLEEKRYTSKMPCKAFIYKDASQISQSEQIKTRVKEDQSQVLQLPSVMDGVSKNDFTDTTNNHDVSVDKKEPEYFKKEEQSVSGMEESLESKAVSIQGQDQHSEVHSSEVSIINKGKDQDVSEMELQEGYLIHYKGRLSIVTDKLKTHIRSKSQREEREHSCKNLIYTYDRNNLDHVTEVSRTFEENKEIMQKKTEDDSSKIQTAVHNEAKLDIKLKEHNNECVTAASDNTCLPQQKLFEKTEASTSWPGDKIKSIKHENITLGNALKNQESNVSQETNEPESQQHKLPKQEFTQIENEQQEIELLSVAEDKGQKISETLRQDFSSVLLNDVHFQQTKEAMTKNKLFEVSHSKVSVETYEEKPTIDKSNKDMIVEEGRLPFSAIKKPFKQQLTRVQEINTSPSKAVLPNGDVEDQSRNLGNNKQHESTNILDYEKDISLEEHNFKGHIKHFHPIESSENDNSIVQSDVSKAMARTQEEDVQERDHKTHFGVSTQRTPRDKEIISNH
ncbi:MIA2 protein, partial [Polypterus senegalus]